MYEEMPINKIMKKYLNNSNDIEEIFNVLKEVIDDLKKEGK